MCLSESFWKFFNFPCLSVALFIIKENGPKVLFSVQDFPIVGNRIKSPSHKKKIEFDDDELVHVKVKKLIQSVLQPIKY